MANVIRFLQPRVPRQNGEIARFRVIQGNDQGATYVLNTLPVVIGRGEECDVLLADTKTSRKHAQFFRTDQGAWIVQDLGSQNGLVYKNQKTRQIVLQSGDQFGLGESLIEFLPSEAATSFLMSPLPEKATSFVEKVKKDPTQILETPKTKAEQEKSKGQRKRLLLIACAGIAVYLYLEEQNSTPKKSAPVAKAATKENPKAVERNLASVLTDVNDPSFQAADAFYKAGFREMRERNYLRAKQQFETALQIYPNHALAYRYLKSSEKEMEGQIKKYLNYARKDMERGKLKSAKSNFQSIKLLLFKNKEDARFKEADDQIRKIESMLKGEGIKS